MLEPSLLADRAGAVHLLLVEFADLPRPSIVDIRGSANGVGVRMQLDDVPSVVAWAARFDTPVIFTEKLCYVDVAVVINIFDVSVKIWTHSTHVAAHRLLQAWGYDLAPGGVAVPAAHAQALAATAAP